MRETWESLIRDFVRHLKGTNRALNTQTIYRRAAVGLVNHLEQEGSLPAPRQLTWRQVEGYIGHLVETRSASTANVIYRALQQFMKWLLDEGGDRPLPHGADEAADRPGEAGNPCSPRRNCVLCWPERRGTPSSTGGTPRSCGCCWTRAAGCPRWPVSPLPTSTSTATSSTSSARDDARGRCRSGSRPVSRWGAICVS